ncbi:hypothetical protein Salat_2980100 [Sesamum alatum]|uniref:Uncharacterized protein n=1 Tax=Sesamum alatum TaxID=300844 RepID=A0AAE1XI40_9LAMI|nr:hypothetical protein Salat_2980100 [Sesamum alatum]
MTRPPHRSGSSTVRSPFPPYAPRRRPTTLRACGVFARRSLPVVPSSPLAVWAGGDDHPGVCASALDRHLNPEPANARETRVGRSSIHPTGGVDNEATFTTFSLLSLCKGIASGIGADSASAASCRTGVIQYVRRLFHARRPDLLRPSRIPGTLAISTNASYHFILPTIPDRKPFYNNSRQQESKKEKDSDRFGSVTGRKIERAVRWTIPYSSFRGASLHESILTPQSADLRFWRLEQKNYVTAEKGFASNPNDFLSSLKIFLVRT